MARTTSALSTQDSKKIDRIVAKLDETQQPAARRFLTKARKVQLGTRTCSMNAGEDGFKDAERDSLLAELKAKPEWIQANRTKLGYARPKPKAKKAEKQAA